MPILPNVLLKISCFGVNLSKPLVCMNLVRLFLRKIIISNELNVYPKGFFHREISRKNLLTHESDSYQDFHELIRNSSYYSRLSPLMIECVELDGIPETLPILIEEVYTNIDEKKSSSEILSSKKSESSIIQTVQNFSKNLIKGTLENNQSLSLHGYC